MEDTSEHKRTEITAIMIASKEGIMEMPSFIIHIYC